MQSTVGTCIAGAGKEAPSKGQCVSRGGLGGVLPLRQPRLSKKSEVRSSHPSCCFPLHRHPCSLYLVIIHKTQITTPPSLLAKEVDRQPTIGPQTPTRRALKRRRHRRHQTPGRNHPSQRRRRHPPPPAAARGTTSGGRQGRE